MFRRLMTFVATVARRCGVVRLVAACRDTSLDDSGYEALVRAALHEAGSLELDALIERIAAQAIRAEMRRGAWVTDIAPWGPSVFRREATLAVRGMIGRSLALECEGPLLAVPVTSAER
ncbi:MAG TPA: hypothetical protein VNL16_02850 [Chloroflexota bacterium]|nr:hypothetical protein [Chloroflexota bacterium]